MNKFILALFVIYVPLYSDAGQDSTRAGREPQEWIIASDAVLIIPSSLLIVINHEFGHYVMATLFGAQDARFGLYRNDHIGWAQWSNDLGRLGNSAAHLGGVLFSRGLAEGSDCVIHRTNLPSLGQRFFSMTFIFGRFDFARYVLTDILADLSGKRRGDIAEFVTQVAGQNAGPRFLTYTALATVAVIDLVFDWNRISTHWNVLGGKPYTVSETESHTLITIHPSVVFGSAGISVDVMW